MKLWLGTLLTASALDIITTTVGLHLGAHEENPMMLFLMSNVSEPIAYCAKLALVGLIVAVVLHAQNRGKRVGLLKVISVMPTVLVVISNVAIVVALWR